MRLGPKPPSKFAKVLKIISVLLLFILITYFLYSQRVNKFDFAGETSYSDLAKIKVLALNLLKDQNIIFYNKNTFEEEIKRENPEIKEVKYSFVSFDKILINLKVVDVCCVLKDINDGLFLISKEGKIIKKISSESKIEFIKLNQEISGNEFFDVNLLFKIEELKNQFQDENLKIEGLSILNNNLEILLSDKTSLIVNSDTDISNLEDKYKSLINYASQNQKKYSVVDFRFDKVIAK